MSPDKLVYMANQIRNFFAHQGEDKAVASIVDHITKFWDPRMRSAIIAHVAAGGERPCLLSQRGHSRVEAAEAGPGRRLIETFQEHVEALR